MKQVMNGKTKNREMRWMERRIQQTRKFGFLHFARRKNGMEMVQVAILVALAVALGIIFKTQITAFVNDVFSKLDSSQF